MLAHLGQPLRRAAERLRSWLGRQERWLLWRPLDEPGAQEHCYPSASTVHRWLDKAGERAEKMAPEQLAKVSISGQVGSSPRRREAGRAGAGR